MLEVVNFINLAIAQSTTIAILACMGVLILVSFFLLVASIRQKPTCKVEAQNETQSQTEIEEKAVEEVSSTAVADKIEEPEIEEVAEVKIEETTIAQEKEEVKVEEKPLTENELKYKQFMEDNNLHMLRQLERTFENKLKQSDKLLKANYSELKNELLSYKKVKCKMSNSGETFKLGRNKLAKVTINGKNLKLHLALAPNDYDVARFPHKDLSEKKAYEEIPFEIKVKSPLSLRRAKTLIADVMAKFNVIKLENAEVIDYAVLFPYEADAELKSNNPTFLPNQINDNMFEDDSVVYLKRNFTNKLKQSDEELKQRYSELLNEFLSYKKVKSRVSNSATLVTFGRKKLAKFSLVGKTLRLYLALDPTKYDVKKFPHNDVSEKSAYKDIPFLVKVKSDLAVKRCKNLIADIMAENETIKLENFEAVDYVAMYPYEQDAVLMANKREHLRDTLGLMLPYQEEEQEETEEEMQKTFAKKVLEATGVEHTCYNRIKQTLLMQDNVTYTIEKTREDFYQEGELKASLIVYGKTLRIYMAIEPKKVSQFTLPHHNVAGEAGFENLPTMCRIRSEVKAKRICKTLEKIFGKKTNDLLFIKRINYLPELEEYLLELERQRIRESLEKNKSDVVYYVDLYQGKYDFADEDLWLFRNEEKDEEDYAVFRKAFVNIDTLNNNFSAGDTVDLSTLKAKGLIRNDVNYVKILARGKIEKALNVKAQEFTNDAIKMILFAGGSITVILEEGELNFIN